MSFGSEKNTTAVVSLFRYVATYGKHDGLFFSAE
jgi:hypothetical protein